MRWPSWERNPDDLLIYEHLGELWLDLSKLYQAEDAPIGLTPGESLYATFTIFTYQGSTYEVQGVDDVNRRLWILDLGPVDAAESVGDAA